MGARIVQLDIYRTSIPMRSFEHAAAKRDVAESVVVRCELADGAQGFGQCLPRPYVTGETIDSVIADLQQVFWPALGARDLDRREDLREALAAAAGSAAGRCVNSAACAVELAVLNAAPQLLPPLGRSISTRVSGVLGSADPAKTAKRLALMRLYGMRDFKLKLGFSPQIDRENLRIVHRRIGKAVAAGKRTLRVDVNGAWDRDSTPQRVEELRPFGVCVVEQPVFCTAAELAELAGKCSLPLMADESLLTMQDAKTLLSAPGVWWNIRISKNGGLLAAAELARLAAAAGIKFTIGAMVGESGILSAAQRWLLQAIEPPAFVEGNYGRWLLRDDLTRPTLRFGYGGRLKPLKAGGVKVDLARLHRYSQLATTLRA